SIRALKPRTLLPSDCKKCTAQTAILTSCRPSRKQVGAPQAQRLHEQHRLHVVELSGIHPRGEVGQRVLDRRRVLVLVGQPAARPGAIAVAARRKVEVHALRRYARHGPDRAHMLEHAEPEACFLPGLAAPPFFRIGALDDPGDGFDHLVLFRRQEHRRAELTHQDRGTPLRVVREHADGLPMILDLAPYGLPVGEADGEDEELAAALMDEVGPGDLKHHVSVRCLAAAKEGMRTALSCGRVPRYCYLRPSLDGPRSTALA